MSVYEEHMVIVRDVDRAKAELENLKDKLKESEQRVLAQMAEDGLHKVHTSMGGLRIKRTVRASAGNNMPRLVDAMRRCGFDDMVTDTVNGTRLGAWVREQFDPQNELSPEEITARLPEGLREAIRVTETTDIAPFSKQW